MSYYDIGTTELIAREGYSGVGGLWDTFKNLGKTLGGGALDVYNQMQQAKGAAAASEEIAKAKASGGMGTGTKIALVGGAAVVILLLIRRRKA